MIKILFLWRNLSKGKIILYRLLRQAVGVLM